MKPIPGRSETCNAMGDILNRIGDKWSVMIVGYLAGKAAPDRNQRPDFCIIPGITNRRSIFPHGRRATSASAMSPRVKPEEMPNGTGIPFSQ